MSEKVGHQNKTFVMSPKNETANEYFRGGENMITPGCGGLREEVERAPSQSTDTEDSRGKKASHPRRGYSVNTGGVGRARPDYTKDIRATSK